MFPYIPPEYTQCAQYSRYPECPSTNTCRLERSDSVPSVHFSGSLEHQPVQPKRRRTGQRYSQHARRPRPRSDPEPRTTYSQSSGLVNPDIIDQLDSAGMGIYHHEGPYDAVYAERNRTGTGPVEALRESNAEALKATPRERIADSVENNRPLDGTAYFPPGHRDPSGNPYDYEEGTNMMNDYGNFVRFPGLKFTDEDFKNDPFYTDPLPKPFAFIMNVFNRCRKRSNTTPTSNQIQI